MSAAEALHEGRLDESIALVKQQVRDDPAEVKHRIFLFQLMAVCGEWDRALTQLEVIGEMDSGALAMVQTYREAIRCEVLRDSVFAGHRTPVVFGEPEQWVALLLEAFRLHAQGQYAEGQQLREEAFAAAPAVVGTIRSQSDETPQRFPWIADADSRIGPVLEAVINGRYYWVPLHRAQRIQIEEPADLRDVVWMPAHFVWANGGDVVGLIPTRYVGSEKNDDSQIRLARRTEWIERGEGQFEGLGQRLLVTDAADLPLMEIREIIFEVAAGDGDATADSPVADVSDPSRSEPNDG